MIDSRQIIIYITLLGMEVSWLYAVLNAANKAVAERLSVPLMLVIFLLSWGISAASRRLRWPRLLLASIHWVIWAIVMLLMIKIQLFPDTGWGDSGWLMAIPHAFSQIFYSFEPALLILITSIAMWWLGRRLAYAKPVFSLSVIEFQLGLIILTLVFFISYALKLDQSSSIPVAIIFFALALLSISISHAKDNNGWLNSSRPGYWSGMLLVSIGLILVIGVLISVIVTPDLLQLIVKFLGWIWGLIEKFLAFIASLLPGQSNEPPPPMSPFPGGEIPQDNHPFSLPSWLTSGLRLVFNIFLIGFVVFVVWRIASQIFGWIRRHTSNSGEERESLKGALKLDLLNWIKRILSKLFRIKFGAPKKGQSRIIPAEIASVRQLYSQLLHWASEKGYPRQAAQTPAEYQCQLNETLPENQSELDFITREYMNSRYGSNVPSQEELQQLKQKWQEMRKTGFKIQPDKNKTNKG